MPPHMPEVDVRPDIDEVFALARRISAGEPAAPGGPRGEPCVAVVTPGRLILQVPLPPGEPNPEMLADLRAFILEAEPQRIVVIAYTDLVTEGALSADKINEHVPFLGYLMGMVYGGHTVVVFEGHPTALEPGCRGADLLIVDKEMADQLQDDWVAEAAGALWKPRILVFWRDGGVTGQHPAQPWRKGQ